MRRRLYINSDRGRLEIIEFPWGWYGKLTVELPGGLKAVAFQGIQRALSVIAADYVDMTVYLNRSMFASPCQHVGHVMPFLLPHIITLG